MHNGVEIVEMKISTIQKDKESLRYIIYPPLLLFLLLCTVFKWGYTMKIFIYLIRKPLDLISSEKVKC